MTLMAEVAGAGNAGTCGRTLPGPSDVTGLAPPAWFGGV